MKTLRFKTNLNSSEAVEAVSLGLNNIERIESWKVDLDHPDRLLTVQAEDTDEPIDELIRMVIEGADYEAQLVTA